MDSKASPALPAPTEASRPRPKGKAAATAAALSVLALTALIRGNFIPAQWSSAYGHRYVPEEQLPAEWGWSSVREVIPGGVLFNMLTSLTDQAKSHPEVA